MKSKHKPYFYLPSKKTKINISQINEALKHLSSRNNFAFVEQKEISSANLWVDYNNLLNSGKAILQSFLGVPITSKAELDAWYKKLYIRVTKWLKT